MKRNIVIFSSPSSLDSVKRGCLDVVTPYFKGNPVDCGLSEDSVLYLLKDQNDDHVSALPRDSLEGELRFVYHSRTFPIPGSGSPPRVNHAALADFVQRVQETFPNLEVQPGKQGKHLRGDSGAFPYEKVIAILTNVTATGNQAHFDAIWEWLEPPDRRLQLFHKALDIHELAIAQEGGGMHTHQVTGRAEIEAIAGWGTLMPNERPPMDEGDEKFREFILDVINQTG